MPPIIPLLQPKLLKAMPIERICFVFCKNCTECQVNGSQYLQNINRSGDKHALLKINMDERNCVEMSMICMVMTKKALWA